MNRPRPPPPVHLGAYGVGRLIAPLFSRFSILNLSLLATGGAAAWSHWWVICTFSFSTRLNGWAVRGTGAVVFFAKMDNFWNSGLTFNPVGFRWIFLLFIRGANPTELEANRRYGESVLSSAFSATTLGDDAA